MTAEKLNPDWTPRPAPEGWTMQTLRDSYSSLVGPFYFREAPRPPGVGFFAESCHANHQGVVHGGALATLADMALFHIAWRSIGKFRAVTVTLNSEFLGPGPVGEFIEATGELTRAGRRMLFVRGMIAASGQPVMSFSGTLKRID